MPVNCKQAKAAKRLKLLLLHVICSAFFVAADEIEPIWIDPPDVDTLLEEDAAKSRQEPRRVSVEISVGGNLQTVGRFDRVEGGTVWRAEICGEKATFVRLNFKAFRLRKGMEMRFYSAGEAPSATMNPITEAQNNEVQVYGSRVVCGECIVAELFLPENDGGGYPALVIDTLSYGYKDFLGCTSPDGAISKRLRGLMERELYPNCYIDPSCASTHTPTILPTIDGSWTDQTRAVAQIYDGTSVCSGSMIADVSQDCTRRLFLTAYHCVGKGNAAKLTFYFDHECFTCGDINTCSTDPDCADSSTCSSRSMCTNHPLDSSRGCNAPYWTEITGGGTFLWGKNDVTTDSTLLEINDPLAGNLDGTLYRAGFDASGPNPNQNVPQVDYFTYIGHPYHGDGKDYKKITQKQELTYGDGYDNYFWKANVGNGNKFLGSSAGGSSGCPGFSPEGRILGPLCCGWGAPCVDEGLDAFGRIDLSWDLKSGGRPMSFYLGDGTGTRISDGMYCGGVCLDGDLCGSGGICCSGSCHVSECTISDLTSCPEETCKSRSCDVETLCSLNIGTCKHSPVADGTGCGISGVCCSGSCQEGNQCSNPCIVENDPCGSTSECCAGLKCKGGGGGKSCKP